jgi:uncharacterized protein YceH (UPF0502 family)
VKQLERLKKRLEGEVFLVMGKKGGKREDIFFYLM